MPLVPLHVLDNLGGIPAHISTHHTVPPDWGRNPLLTGPAVAAQQHVVSEILWIRLPKRIISVIVSRITRVQGKKLLQGNDRQGRQWVRFGLASSGGHNPPLWELTWALLAEAESEGSQLRRIFLVRLPALPPPSSTSGLAAVNSHSKFWSQLIPLRRLVLASTIKHKNLLFISGLAAVVTPQLCSP
ncbi:hypothetical protein DFH09DRAFT_1083741 [Mycena vulgaris]|nr:hypothetical protein DFH09DRAFT_1083741 [Mycena vulgaris]